ncbi:MAG TPA: pitrilysin family protein [Vicinamibacterales bacterium]|nr:pitrilysin family protein [Vicinamibacterales bacterium]
MFMRSAGRWAIAAALATMSAAALTAQSAPTIRFTDAKLANGLRVVVSEDHTAPVYSIAVHYNVGSRDERKGRTGFAHLFEHMMFKGSENVGPGEHFMLVFNNGGSMNGTTNKDRTLYFETLPANQLDLGIFLEADRMRSLAITKENLDNQRNAVQEERRLGVDNQPYGRTFELLDELAYDNPAYEHSVIGSMTDLNAASVDDVAAFFKTYYAPNNAVVAIVGDVDAKGTLEKVRRVFEPIPSQPPPPKVDMTEPKQTAERRQTIDDPLARLARIDIVFKVPPRLTADDDALQVLGTVLSSGRSSRMYQQIVREQQLAPNVSAGRDGAVGPGLFRVSGTVNPGKTVEALESAIAAEIDKVKTGPIQDWEMEKARNNAKRSVVSGLTSSLNRAIQLADFAASYGDPALINQRVERIAKVTAADVQRVARAYLVPENRTVVITRPKGSASSSGGAR